MVGDLVKAAEKSKSQIVSVTKADLITVIADKLKLPWARAELLVDVGFECMEQSMSRGEKIEIRATHPNYPYTRLPSPSWPERFKPRHRTPPDIISEPQSSVWHRLRLCLLLHYLYSGL